MSGQSLRKGFNNADVRRELGLRDTPDPHRASASLWKDHTFVKTAACASFDREGRRHPLLSREPNRPACDGRGNASAPSRCFQACSVKMLVEKTICDSFAVRMTKCQAIAL